MIMSTAVIHFLVYPKEKRCSLECTSNDNTAEKEPNSYQEVGTANVTTEEISNKVANSLRNMML
jgi:hypothetical protein